jgi:hypothetical protein
LQRIAHIDFIGGVLLIAVGLFFAFYGSGHYAFGELRRMGPGFFPIVLGYVLAGLGVILLISAMTGVIERVGSVQWRAMVAVLLGLSVFALTVDKIGMVPSTILLTVIVAFGERRFRPVRTLVLAALLAVISVSIFTYGLGLPIPAFRWNI